MPEGEEQGTVAILEGLSFLDRIAFPDESVQVGMAASETAYVPEDMDMMNFGGMDMPAGDLNEMYMPDTEMPEGDLSDMYMPDMEMPEGILPEAAPAEGAVG
jgi:hypothetical protein